MIRDYPAVRFAIVNHMIGANHPNVHRVRDLTSKAVLDLLTNWWPGFEVMHIVSFELFEKFLSELMKGAGLDFSMREGKVPKGNDKTFVFIIGNPKIGLSYRVSFTVYPDLEVYIVYELNEE